MRFYDVQISQPDGGALVRQYTSFVNGQSDPNALTVELDITTVGFAAPDGEGAQYVRIWGISIQEIGQAAQLTGNAIVVYGGMKAGLPLANPAQSGLLVRGYIWQAFGNWVGVNMTLDLIIKAGPPPLLSGGTVGNPTAASTARNIAWNWQPNTTMADAIQASLSGAFPGYSINVSISNQLKRTTAEVGHYQSLVTFAQMVKRVSASIIGGNYAGVDIGLVGQVFSVTDSTTTGGSQSNPIAIAFTDLVGQPTWVGFNEIQVTCVMRADIGFNSFITLPPTQVTNTAQSLSQFRQGSIFNGTFQVIRVRHVGNSRSPEGEAWVTTLNALLQPKATGVVMVEDLDAP